MEIIELSAWHESGRVVYAYMNGYTCDGIELSATDSGNGISRLNAGPDIPFVQAILNGKASADIIQNPVKAAEVARKLMKIYCAGSCTEIFIENNKQLSTQTEINIPGKDLTQIELIQKFLIRHVPGHSDDFMSLTIMDIFRELKKEEVWKPIEMLAAQLLKPDNIPFTRFNIEDALMLGGLKLQKKNTANTFGFSVKEETASPSQTEVFSNEKILDKVLKDFLLTVRPNWMEEELSLSVEYLKEVFRKFSGR